MNKEFKYWVDYIRRNGQFVKRDHCWFVMWEIKLDNGTTISTFYNDSWYVSESMPSGGKIHIYYNENNFQPFKNLISLRKIV